MTSHPPVTVLILSAGVSRGRQAAEGVRDELDGAAPEMRVVMRNGLGDARGPLRLFLERLTRWHGAAPTTGSAATARTP